MVVFKLTVQHQTIISVTEMSTKMASTLCPKWYIFVKKNSTICQFVPYDFVQISPACGPNTYQIMYGETLDFQCQHQQW